MKPGPQALRTRAFGHDRGRIEIVGEIRELGKGQVWIDRGREHARDDRAEPYVHGGVRIRGDEKHAVARLHAHPAQRDGNAGHVRSELSEALRSVARYEGARVAERVYPAR